jgi:hypothetical protein
MPCPNQTGAAARNAQKAEALITSTVCDISMPHAFCLNRECVRRVSASVSNLTWHHDHIQTASKWHGSPATGSSSTACRMRITCSARVSVRSSSYETFRERLFAKAGNYNTRSR